MMISRTSSLALISCALLTLTPATRLAAQRGDRADEVQAPPPKHLEIPPSPILLAEEAVKTLKVADGYRVEIAAADPLVGDPVAMTFAPDGRLWVVEMRGFMPNADGVGEDAKVGSVAVLEDTDRDGRMDKRNVFLDGLVLPRALALVGDGVLVAEPPHLWFCRDTDGDGRADEKTEIASDYGAQGNPEHTANGLLRGIDNWIYSANHNVRFRYLGNGRFEKEFTIMRGQWGISQDDTGRLYYNTNSDPLRYDALPSHYFARNPALADPYGLNLQVVPANLRVWPLRVTPGINRGYQSLDETGRMTAATATCAPFYYRDALLTDLGSDVFICEPAGNLVKRISLLLPPDASKATTLKGENAHEGAEFLASTDERFRPVNLANGPDGGLYVVDMYRGIIQHRIYLTTFLRRQIEERGLAEGLGMGRIYRVIPAAGAPRPGPFDLTQESTAQLVERLRSPGAWWRDTAQRLLVERGDPGALPLLKQVVADSKASTVSRIQALWTLEGLKGLDPATVRLALQSPDPDVRSLGIRFAEPFLQREQADVLSELLNPDLSTSVYSTALQQALSLGASPDDQVMPVLLGLAERFPDDRLMASAIVSGLAGREAKFLRAATSQFDAANATLVLAAYSGWRSADPAAVANLDALLAADDLPSWLAGCLIDGLERAVPVRNEGQRAVMRLATAPVALQKIAAEKTSAVSARVNQLLPSLRWPGNDDRATAAAPLTPSQQALFDKGHEVYSSICTGCHQPTGQGLQGLAPALVNSKWVAGDERALARIVLQGKMREGSIMPPLQSLDDESLAGALTFIRRSWGHTFDPVSPETIAHAREETEGRAEPWTEKDLAKFLEADRIKAGAH